MPVYEVEIVIKHKKTITVHAPDEAEAEREAEKYLDLYDDYMMPDSENHSYVNVRRNAEPKQ